MWRLPVLRRLAWKLTRGGIVDAYAGDRGSGGGFLRVGGSARAAGHDPEKGHRGDRRNRRAPRLHRAENPHQHHRDQRRAVAGARPYQRGGCDQGTAGRLGALRRPRPDGIRGARPILHRRRRADRGLLSERRADVATGCRANRQNRDRPRPLRHPVRRGAARAAGHPVRLRLDGRHHPRAHRPAQLQRL